MDSIDKQIADFFRKEDKKEDRSISEMWTNPALANNLVYSGSEVGDETDTI